MRRGTGPSSQTSAGLNDNPTHHGLPHCGSLRKLQPLLNTPKAKSALGPLSARRRPRSWLTGSSYLRAVAGRRATRVPAHTPRQAARSCAHTATASADVPREVRASGTAASAASSMGEPRAAYLRQPSAAPPPAPQQPPSPGTQLSDVRRARGRAQQGPARDPRARQAGCYALLRQRAGAGECCLPRWLLIKNGALCDRI